MSELSVLVVLEVLRAFCLVWTFGRVISRFFTLGELSKGPV